MQSEDVYGLCVRLRDELGEPGAEPDTGGRYRAITGLAADGPSEAEAAGGANSDAGASSDEKELQRDRR